MALPGILRAVSGYLAFEAYRLLPRYGHMDVPHMKPER